MSSLKPSAGLLTLATLTAAPLFAGSGISFERDYERAVQRAQKENRPLMIDFRAEWCSWCHRLDKTTYKDPSVVELVKGTFIAVKVDTEGDGIEVGVTRRYDVRDLPTIVFVTPSGIPVHRVDGFQGPGQFPATLERARESAKTVMSYEDALKSEPDDPLALSALGSHLFERSLYAESKDMLDRARQIDRESPVAYRKRTRMLLAIMASADRQYEIAESYLRQGLLIGTSAEYDPKLLYLLARNYLNWNRPETAVEFLKQILVEHPRSAMASKARETLQAMSR